MNMIRKVSVAALSLVLLAGCGSASTKETHDDHKLTVGMECNYAPFNWSTTTANEYTQQISTVDTIAMAMMSQSQRRLRIHWVWN